MTNSNLDQLVTAAKLLRPLLEDLVFVGGCVTGLLVTDKAAGAPRSTLDVDTIAEIKSYMQYAQFGERLRALGFTEDNRESAPVCRWIQGRIVLDVMPLDEKILGFSNRWYRAAMKSSSKRKLSRNLEIRLITAPFFLATKLEAFKGRGKGDFLGSHDLEDMISVVDGRPALVAEVRAAPKNLRVYLQAEMQHLLAKSSFIDALSGYLFPDAASQSRINIVLERLRNLASA